MTDIVRAKARRLHILKLQRAIHGYQTQPAIEMEIEDLERQDSSGVRGYGKVFIERDLPAEIDMLTRTLNKFMVICGITLSASTLMSIADFILIVRGR